MAKKKEVHAKKSDSKEIVESTKTDTPEEQKSLNASVKIKDGNAHCTLVMGKGDVKVLDRSTGCKAFDAATAVITNGMHAVMGGTNDAEVMDVANKNYLAMMAELKPKDAFEGMLVSQMSVTYMQAMDCLKMAASNKNSSKIFERFQNQGIKLMRLYNQQLETLDKHRRKGNQKMTVEHVNVHDGGKAVVGNIQGGGGKNE